MKYVFCLVTTLVVLSCNQTEDKPQEEAPVVQVLPQPSQLELSVKAALIDILKSNFEASGNKADSIQISGMEIVRISRKDYLIDEKNSQIINFDKYLKYVEKFKNTSNKMYVPAEIASNKEKHAAVLVYLDKMIKHASEEKDLYKVAYYLKVEGKNLDYTQLQTTYLDADLKKVTSDYSHLKRSK